MRERLFYNPTKTFPVLGGQIIYINQINNTNVIVITIVSTTLSTYKTHLVEQRD